MDPARQLDALVQHVVKAVGQHEAGRGSIDDGERIIAEFLGWCATADVATHSSMDTIMDCMSAQSYSGEGSDSSRD